MTAPGDYWMTVDSVRHVRTRRVSDGNAPSCQTRAVRSLIPAAAAAAAIVLTAMRCSRKRRTCLSVTTPTSASEPPATTVRACCRPANLIVVGRQD